MGGYWMMAPPFASPRGGAWLPVECRRMCAQSMPSGGILDAKTRRSAPA